MDYVISVEDGNKHTQLVDHLHHAVTVAAPLVVETSGLTLDVPVRVRLVSPAGYRAANQDYFRWVAEGVLDRDDLRDAERTMTEQMRRWVGAVIGVYARAAWPCVGGQTLKGRDGGHEILILPQALRRNRSSRDQVTAIVSHELTHVAQQLASPATEAEMALEALRGLNRDAGAGHSALWEGHATWVHWAVTRKLFGEEVASYSAKHPWRGRVLKRVPVMAEKAASYERGRLFVEAVVQEEGVGFINRAWRGPDHEPTDAEIDVPHRWVARMKAAAAAVSG